MVFETKHFLGMTTANGTEILFHVGLIPHLVRAVYADGQSRRQCQSGRSAFEI
ncbi:MAG: hypothetical protein ACLSA6_09830 [Holdemania massiliensis]